MKVQDELLSIPVAVRLTEDEASQLDQMRSGEKRTRSNMLRLLIVQEYLRQFKSKKSTYQQPESSPQV